MVVLLYKTLVDYTLQVDIVHHHTVFCRTGVVNGDALHGNHKFEIVTMDVAAFAVVSLKGMRHLEIELFCYAYSHGKGGLFVDVFKSLKV